MSELIAPPTSWKFALSKSAAAITAQLKSDRVLSIKSFLEGKDRVYSAVLVKDIGLGGSWNGKITPANLKSTLGKTFRLTALDCFEEGKQTFCAAAWVKDKPAVTWDWDFNLTAKDLNARLKKENGKLTNIRAYMTTLGGELTDPALRYCAIWVKDDGIPWDWIPDATADSISDTLDQNSGMLISIDNIDNTVWLGDQEKFCAVWYKDVSGQTWFWNFGLDINQLPKEPPKFCSWGLDVAYCTKDRFVSLMQQFPKPADPNLATLMSLSGNATATFQASEWLDIQWNLTEQNLVADQVDMQSAFMFSAAEGGWSWWSGNFTNPSGQNVMGMPLSLAAGQSYPSTPWWTVSNAPKIGIFPIKAATAGGKHQYLLAQAVISQSGLPAPATLPIHWPIFLGIQGPVEVVKLTNGKSWATVAAQVINGTGDKMDINSVSVRLKDQNNATVHKGDFTNNLLADQDVLGQSLSPALTGSILNADVPLPKFYDGFEVPASFTSGKVRIQAEVKFQSGPLDCYGDTRILDVALAPQTFVSHLPYGVPVINGSPDPTFRWHWGNGIGGTSFNAHSYPEHRYSYDIGIYDTSNQTFKDPTKLDQNGNFYSWGQDVLAISSGQVVYVDSAFEDNFGRTANPNSKGANLVVVYNKEANFFHLYAHFQQNSIVVAVGDMVSPGAKLGLLGNSGGSSEPHLHVGINRQDAQGFLRSLPMTFEKIKNGAGQFVSGVPVDGEFYSQS
ncbi:MAG TPA: M23 family metallopeptidase [Anaerolineales bacterium]|nr:M23 family metallopeptidase [Anaerolineales bacterium]